MSNPVLQGINSVVDTELFDIQSLGSSLTAAPYNFFSDSVGKNKAYRTNLQTPNTIPTNWQQFTVTGFTMQFLTSELAITDYLAFFNKNGFYQFTLGQTPLRYGSIAEFCPIVAITETTFEVGTSVVDTVSIHEYVDKKGAYIPLTKGYEISIPSNTAFGFTLTLTADVTGLHNVNLKVGIKGQLSRQVIG